MKDFISSKGERARGPARPSAKRAQGAGPPRGGGGKSLAAIAAVAAIALGAWWWMAGAEPRRPETETPPKHIHPKVKGERRDGSSAVKPQRTARRHVFVATNEIALATNMVRPEITMADVFFECKRADGTPTNPRPIFKNPTENYIAGVITEPPGTRFLDPALGEDFDELFKASLATNIVISEDDPEDVRQIKESVIRAKQAICEYMKDGARPSDIVKEARMEMNKIADFRDDMKKALAEFMETGTVEDTKAFHAECNKILAEYNALPLQLTEEELQEVAERCAERSKGGSPVSPDAQ